MQKEDAHCPHSNQTRHACDVRLDKARLLTEAGSSVYSQAVFSAHRVPEAMLRPILVYLALMCVSTAMLYLKCFSSHSLVLLDLHFLKAGRHVTAGCSS